MGDGRLVLEVEGVRVGYDAHPVLDGVTLRLARGEWLGVVGPNGSGKTTLLRTVAGYLRARAGRVVLLGRPLERYGHRERARQVAVASARLPQEFGFTVAEYVALGRTPHGGPWSLERREDAERVRRALSLTGLAALADRPLERLSAGERQRVELARALAQEPRLLLLDEPTAHLDIRHQLETMDLLDRLRRQEGLTLVGVFHDLNLAALYCDRLLLLAAGRVYAAGPPPEVLRPQHLEAVYGCPVCVLPHPATGAPQVILLPLGR